MNTRSTAICLALASWANSARAQPAPVGETWTPVSRNAQSITGKVTLTPTQIMFQNGAALPLTHGVQMLFRPEKKKKVVADLYKVAQPANPVLENGKTLCQGKPVAYLLVWKSEKVGSELDARSMNVFSGTKFVSGSPDDCGRFMYDAGPR
jgi:hypothetical protein